MAGAGGSRATLPKDGGTGRGLELEPAPGGVGCDVSTFPPANFLSGETWTSGEGGESGAELGSDRLLLERITFGPSYADRAMMAAIGREAYLARQLAYETIDDSALEAELSARYPWLLMSVPEMVAAWVEEIDVEHAEVAITRALRSPRQLFERVVEMWNDHFNITSSGLTMAWTRAADERDVIRAHAMGKFRDLLGASARSAAMVIYLDNARNVAVAPNENYAREVMELHTTGVGAYTEDDVREVARCFTGWTTHLPNAGDQALTFRFDPALHDDGQKTVLGHVIPGGGGITDGETVLDILASHPSTARHVSARIARHFITPAPGSTLVDRLAAVFTASGGDLREVVREALSRRSLAHARPKFKRPFHFAVGVARALQASMTYSGQLRLKLAQAGHMPFKWETPDGYPDRTSYWAGALLWRWRLAASLMYNEMTGVEVDVPGLMFGARTVEQVAARIDSIVFGGAMPMTTRLLLEEYLRVNRPSNGVMAEALGLAVSSPEYQWF